MFGMNCRECGRRPGGAYLTAYQIALKHGFKGTEAQWIKSIGTMRAIHVTEEAGGVFECDASLGTIRQMMEDGFIPVLITKDGLPAFLSNVTDEMLSFSTMLIRDLEGDYYDCYSMSGREYTVERIINSGSDGGGGSIGPNSITYNMLTQNVRNALDNAAEASQKLENGITEDDLASDVKAILDAVAGKYVKPGNGIPLGDLSAEVQSLIGQGGYVKPPDGIPKADLDDMVNAALTKAENAVLRSGLLAKPNGGSFDRAYIDQSGNVWCPKAEAVTVTLSAHPETTAAMLSSRTVSELYADTQMGRIIYVRDVSGRVGTLVDPPDSPYDTAVYAVIDLDHNQVLMYVQSGNTVTMTPVSYDARGVYRIPETGIPEQHLDAAVRAKLNASGGGGGIAPLVGVTDAESEGYASPVVVKGALDIGRPVSLAHNDGTTDYLFTAFGATGGVVTGVIAGENLTFYILTGTVSGWTFATVQAASAAALTALSAQVAPPVVGTTENKTPQQIAEAIEAGKSVYLTHTVDGSTYGFHAWYKTPAAVIGVGSVGYSGGVNHVTLTGSLLNGRWAMESTRTPAAPLVVTVVEDQQAANGYSADHTAAEVFNAMQGGLSVELVFEKGYDSFEGSLVEYNDTTAIFSLLDTTISNFPSLRVFVLEDDYITCTEIPIRELTPGNVGMGFFTCWGTGEDDPCDIPDEHFMPLSGAPFFVRFNSALASNAEMTVDDGARKPLYYRGAPITANTIQAGDIATVVVNSGKYVIVGIDRDEAGSGSGTADVTAAAVATAIAGMNTTQKNDSRTALGAEAAGAASAVQTNLNAVISLIPSSASANNQLATKGDLPTLTNRDSSTDTVEVKKDPTTQKLYVPTYPSGGSGSNVPDPADGTQAEPSTDKDKMLVVNALGEYELSGGQTYLLDPDTTGTYAGMAKIEKTFAQLLAEIQSRTPPRFYCSADGLAVEVKPVAVNQTGSTIFLSGLWGSKEAWIMLSYIGQAMRGIVNVVDVRDPDEASVSPVSGTSTEYSVSLTKNKIYRIPDGNTKVTITSVPTTGTAVIIFTTPSTIPDGYFTKPSAMKMPADWEGVEASTRYEINVMDGYALVDARAVS